jgi:hypothetical protein
MSGSNVTMGPVRTVHARQARAPRVALLVALLAAAAACSPATPTPAAIVAAPSVQAPAGTPPPVETTTPIEPSPSPSPSPSPMPSTDASPSVVPTPTPAGPVFSFDPNASADPGPTQDPGGAYALLDGVRTTPAMAVRLPVAVMVDDNVQARPQYGFNAASIVYQAPADGGETRYMMVFQEQQAKRIEPVRSGRPYFVNFAAEYRAAFAHYGGDAKTLAYLPSLHKRVLWNVDALAGGGSAFRRDHARKAPHNGVTSTSAVRRVALAKGARASLPAGAAMRVFAADLPEAQRPAKGAIRIPYNRGATTYTYDKAHNQYLRSVAGRPQRDAADGKRVIARNVIVLFMKYSTDPQSEPGYHRPVFGHIGTGKALVFRDGRVFKGTWKKPSAAALTRFYGPDGTEISLVRGRIFIQIVPTGAKVTYSAKA